MTSMTLSRRFLSAALAALLLATTGLPTMAARTVLPKGTDVKLEFDTAMSSKTAKEGDKVRFHVTEDVKVDDAVVIREGTPVTGTITKVNKRGRYGVNARIQLKMSSVKTVSGRYAPLGYKTKGQAVGERTGEAAGATAGGALLLGPLGLAAGYFIVGKTVEAKPGDKMTVEVAKDIPLGK